MNKIFNLLKDGLDQLSFLSDEKQISLFLSYVELLDKWNKTFNLTAIKEIEKMVTYHVLDSLTVLPFILDAKTFADVGSGGGMPGMPIAISRPDLSVTLVESNNKKAIFLNQTAIALGLNNVTVLEMRVEKIQEKSFDIVTSRAFAELNDFVSITEQLLSENGYWLAMKGVYPYEEIAQLNKNIDVLSVDKVHVPFLEAERHIVLLSKGKS